ncbi:MAG: AI-2E family transporter [bacterium]|nr:AI-2E family transporter [bacterium]
MTENWTGAERLQRGFLVLLAVGISLLFLQMIRGFVMALLLAAIFAALTHPVYRRLVKLFGGRRALASATTILLALVLVVGPLTTFVGVVVKQAVDVSSSVRPWVEEQVRTPGALQGYLERIPFSDKIAPYRDEILTKAGEMAGKTATFVVNGLTSAGKGTARFLLNLFVMLYAMFYFLMDGRKMLEKALYYLPLDSEDEEAMLDRFTSVTRAALKGTLLIGIIQGTLAALSFLVAGIPGVFFWGTLMAVLSVIPGIGAALIWVPAVAYLAMTGKIAAAVGVGLWCAIVVGTIDNVLRPRLVGQDTKMPDLLILISTLGGLALFGAVGVILGPIVAALFITVWDLYGVAFKDVLPAVAPAPAKKD